MKEIHLFVQEGCRPCLYAETQLKKVDGWQEVVNITNAKVNDAWSQLSKDCGVEATPTLVALTDGNIAAKMAGSQDMTVDFWRATVKKHGHV